MLRGYREVKCFLLASKPSYIWSKKIILNSFKRHIVLLLPDSLDVS